MLFFLGQLDRLKYYLSVTVSIGLDNMADYRLSIQ